jgi:hypothetical protein
MSDNKLIGNSVLFGIIIFIVLINNISINNIIYIVIAVIFSYLFYVYFNPENSNNVYDKIVNTMNKKYTPFDYTQQSLLYKNPALLTIFARFLPYCKFDTKNYKEALVAGNQLVLLYESAKKGHRFPNQSIDLAEQLQRDIMNSCQALVLSFPTTVVADYRYEANLNVLQKVLQNIIDNIKLIYEDKYSQYGPDIHSPPPSINNGPWKNPLDDKEYNSYWNFYY